MRDKTEMSSKTKKILTGLGISFGTVMVFIVSFILAFSLIVNPINFFTVTDAGTAEENQKLKEEVQILNDRIEHLNTTVDKYKAQASAPSPSTPAIVTTPEPNTGTGTGTGSTNAGGNQTVQSPQPDSGAGTDGNSEPADGGEESGFSPDTVDSSAETTPEDVEIPIINISE